MRDGSVRSGVGGIASLGTARLGTARHGTAPLGIAPLGIAPLGIAPHGTAPLGIGDQVTTDTHERRDDSAQADADGDDRFRTRLGIQLPPVRRGAAGRRWH